MPSTLAILGGQPLRTRPFPTWPVFDARERAQLEDVLTSSSWGGYPSPNRKATEFAAAFAAYQGARFAIPTTSGTSALEVALKALGIGAGDEVIVPAITFAATPYAAVACMARPVFADVSATNACIDPESVERLITRRTKAIIPVHYGASLADLDALAEISRAHSIPLVEDCAHVPGAQFRDRGVGTHGALGCFSFQSSKPMTAGEGGMITTNDPDLEQRCQSLINCGRRRPSDDFEGPLMGANYRMTEWQCGILLAQLARLSEQIEHKSRAAARLREGLGAIKGLSPVARDPRVTRETSTHSFFSSRNPRSASRAIDSSAHCAPRASHAASPTIPSIAPHSSRASPPPIAKPANSPAPTPTEITIDCPVAERLFEHAIVSIPHECLLGDDRDVDDIIAAAAKVASRATELAAAKLK